MIYINSLAKTKSTLDSSVDLTEELLENYGKIHTKCVSKENYTPNLRSLEALVNRLYYNSLNFGIIDNTYTEFKIPKASGGYRTLHAPSDQLKILQRSLVSGLSMSKALPHNSAHAYTSHRNTLTELKVHQKNKSRWFLKIDLKDFFPSCTKDWVVSQLKQVHPFAAVEQGMMDSTMHVYFREGSLPQGAPTSPVLSNLAMTPIDYSIEKALGSTFVYTRYADDILISSTTHFDYQFVVDLVSSLLPSNLKINYRKVRYGSCNGRNWNLGLMYNKDMNITVGHRQKKLIKTRVHNWINNEARTNDEYFVIRGVLSYYQSIEPEYFDRWIKRFETKGFKL